jgi:hypothetical protein
MGQIMRFQEILRKLAIIDEGFLADQARLGLDPAGPTALDAKTAALVRVGVLAAIGAPAVGLEWGTTRALATGRPKKRSPASCWPSPRWPGWAGWSAPSPTWRPRSDTTSRPRCTTQTSTDGPLRC